MSRFERRPSSGRSPIVHEPLESLRSRDAPGRFRGCRILNIGCEVVTKTCSNQGCEPFFPSRRVRSSRSYGAASRKIHFRKISTSQGRAERSDGGTGTNQSQNHIHFAGDLTFLAAPRSLASWPVGSSHVSAPHRARSRRVPVVWPSAIGRKRVLSQPFQPMI
jgi:uncharacterized protein (DUF3084 family)